MKVSELYFLFLFIFVLSVTAATHSASASSRLRDGGFKKEWAHDSTKKDYKSSKSEKVLMGPPAPVYCGEMPFEPVIYINFHQMPVKYDYSVPVKVLTSMMEERFDLEDIEDIDKRADREYILHQTEMHKDFKHTVGLTRSSFAYYPGSSILTKRNGNRSGCVFVNNIKLEIEGNFKVYVASEIAKNECRKDMVLTHEALHVEAHTAMMEKYEKYLREELERFAGSYKAKRLTENLFETEIRHIRGRIRQITDEVMHKMGKEDASLQTMIDSRGEYAYYSIACQSEPW